MSERRVIWKFPVQPRGAELLSVGVQNGNPVLWALVEPRNERGNTHNCHSNHW